MRDIRQPDMGMKGRGHELVKFQLRCAFHINMPLLIRYSAVQKRTYNTGRPVLYQIHAQRQGIHTIPWFKTSGSLLFAVPAGFEPATSC